MASDLKVEDNTSCDKTVGILFVCLVMLVVLLIVLYKKLNRDTNGQYTVRRIVYKEGGLRDRARGAVMVLETRLGMQLWPRATAEDDGDEMQEIQDDEARVERGSRGGESEGEEEEEEEEEEGGGEMRSNGDDSSDDYSSMEGSDLRERAVLKDHQEAKGETEGRMEGKGKGRDESVEDGEGKEKASGGAGLLIDLKQFSGSAIWSEEKRIEDNDVTAL